MKLRALFLLAGTLAASACASQASAATPAATRALVQQPARTRIHSAGSYAHESSTTAVIASRSSSTSDYSAGQAALKARRYTAAVRYFQAAIDHHVRVFDAYIGLGTADVALARYADGFRAYRRAASLQPRNAGVLYKAAYAALNANDYHNAVAYATRYLALKPHDGNGYHLRFLAYGGLLDAKHQLDDARLVARYEPNSATAFNDLGIALAQNRQYKASEAALTKAIALQPGNWQFYKNRGLAEYRNNQLTLALHDFQRAERLVKDPLQRSNLRAAIAVLQKQMHH